MKLREAAALALVGWYLMVPHQKADGSLVNQSHLSEWKIRDRYNSLAGCEAAREELNKDGEEFMREVEKHTDLSVVSQAAVLLAAQCVASNDPRLKPN